MAVVDSGPSAEKEQWEDERLESALGELQEMHNKLRQLRTSIPDIVANFGRPHSSPAALFKDFSNSATSATNDIKSFMKDMQTERVQSILARAAESRKESPAGIRPWRVTEHPDWADRDGAPKDEDQQGLAGASHNIDTVMDDNSSSNETGDLKGTLDQFAKEHPDIQTASKEETQTIEISLPAPANIVFEIGQTSGSAERTACHVTCKGTNKLHTAIERSIATRPDFHDCSSLLELLASYTDVFSRKCVKCGRLLDSKPQFPAARRKRTKRSADGDDKPVWDAYHEGCL